MSGYLEHAIEEFEIACGEFEAEPSPYHRHRRLIQFGTAAITLDAARAERGPVPQTFATEAEQAVGLAYAIRCCPAHDNAEPVWQLWGRYRRIFEVGGITIDLSARHEQHFEFEHIGGLGTLHALAALCEDNELLGPAS